MTGIVSVTVIPCIVVLTAVDYKCMGVLTDEISATWKRAMGANIDQFGPLRFIWAYLEGVDPRNSMGERFRTATFIRKIVAKTDYCALYLGTSVGINVVMRTIFRLVGLPQVVLYQDLVAWQLAVDSMLRGHKPIPPVHSE